MRGTWTIKTALATTMLFLAPIAALADETLSPTGHRDSAGGDMRRPQICTEQYDPVCGRIGDEYRMYSNACFARAAGARIVYDRPCNSGHHGRPVE